MHPIILFSLAARMDIGVSRNINDAVTAVEKVKGKEGGEENTMRQNELVEPIKLSPPLQQQQQGLEEEKLEKVSGDAATFELIWAGIHSILML